MGADTACGTHDPCYRGPTAALRPNCGFFLKTPAPGQQDGAGAQAKPRLARAGLHAPDCARDVKGIKARMTCKPDSVQGLKAPSTTIHLALPLPTGSCCQPGPPG